MFVLVRDFYKFLLNLDTYKQLFCMFLYVYVASLVERNRFRENSKCKYVKKVQIFVQRAAVDCSDGHSALHPLRFRLRKCKRSVLLGIDGTMRNNTELCKLQGIVLLLFC